MNYPQNFLDTLNFTLKQEGGISNNKNDSGGLTNKGITQATYDAFRKKYGEKNQSVRLLSNDELDAIYYNEYWLGFACDELPDPFAFAVFDFRMNSGHGVKILQGLLDLPADGVIGKNTIAALDAYITANGMEKAYMNYADARERFYQRLGVDIPKDMEFEPGWNNRVNAVKAYYKNFTPTT